MVKETLEYLLPKYLPDFFWNMWCLGRKPSRIVQSSHSNWTHDHISTDQSLKSSVDWKDIVCIRSIGQCTWPSYFLLDIVRHTSYHGWRVSLLLCKSWLPNRFELASFLQWHMKFPLFEEFPIPWLHTRNGKMTLRKIWTGTHFPFHSKPQWQTDRIMAENVYQGKDNLNFSIKFLLN